MSLRMVSLWIVGALLVAAILKADPPQPLAPELPLKPGVKISAENNQVVIEGTDSELKATSVEFRESLRQQIRFDVMVWDVDHAVLRALIKTEMGVHEFYKANGLIKQPDWIAAAISDAVGELLSPPDHKNAAPAPLPVRAFAVRDKPVSKKLLGHDISSAFKTITEPTLVATNGREATMLSGGEMPVLVPQNGNAVAIDWLEFGLKLKILPRLVDEGRIALGLDFENSEVDRKSDAGESGISLISSLGFRLSAQMKLGEQLLVAQQIGKQDVTRLVQIRPTLVGDQIVAEKPNGPPTIPADRSVIEQFAGQFDAPAEAVPSGDTKATKPSANPAPFKTHNGILGEDAESEKTVVFQVRVYEVDHSQWENEGDSSKRQKAFDEVLRPWMDGRRGSKLDKKGVKAWATKGTVLASDLEKLSPTVRLVSESKLGIDDGQTGSFDYGGKTPQLSLSDNRDGGSSHLQPLATNFAVESAVTDAGRVLISVFFNPHGQLRKTRSTNEELKQNGVTATSELSVGQTLCLSDARLESSSVDDSLFVTITPVEITTPDPRRTRSVAAKPKKPADLEITVEDRWPIADIKVGQRVVAVPVTIEKTSMQADTTALAFSYESKYSQRVIRIEPLPNRTGRRVTISVPFQQHEEANDQLKTIVENYLDGIQSSSSTFVIPTTMVSMTDFMSGRPVQDFYGHIPVELRPQPVELTVGDSFTAYGVAALMGSAKAGAHHEIGAFSFDYLDDDAGGIWRTTATKIGTARLIQLAVGSEMLGPVRLTEYLVKADTRELELHIRQQFPSAKVTITSVGAVAVMLKGTVASDEDATGIVELAEQFAPKVLNRLKVGATTQAATESNAVRQANGIADDADSKSTGERAPPQRTPLAELGVAESNILEPQPVRPRKATRDVPSKATELQQLRDEIRELRQEVHELIQRLDREQAATPKNNHNTKPWIQLGQAEKTWREFQFAKLVLEFNELMDQKRFAEAEVIAKQAVELDPKNPLPQTLTFKAALSRRVADDEKQLRSARVSDPAGTVDRRSPGDSESALESGRPAVGTAAGSGNPRRAQDTKLDPMPSPPTTIGVTENDLRIAEQLETVVQLEAKNLPLEKVIEQLARKADINIVLDKTGLEEAGVADSTPMSLTLSGVNLRSALKIVLDPLKLGHVIDGEVLKITSQQRAEGPFVVKVYSVADLLGGREPHSRQLDSLVQLIRGIVAPKSWRSVSGPGSIVHETATTSLFVRQTQAVHDELHEFLDLLRRTARPANSGNAAAGLSHLTPEEIRITFRLQKPIDLELEQVTLHDAFKKISDSADFNVILDKAGLEAESITVKTPVSIRLKGVRLATALRLLLEPLGLDYVVKHEVLLITSRSRVAGQMTVATYVVADLLQPMQPEEDELNRLSQLIQDMIEPNSWDSLGGNAHIKVNASTKLLVVRQSQANHSRIREFLETKRRPGNQPRSAPVSDPAETSDRRSPDDLESNLESGRPAVVAAAGSGDPRRAQDWQDLTARRTGKYAENKIDQQLATKVTVNFENTPLKNLLEHLSKFAKLEIQLDPDGLEDESITAETPVSISVTDITLRSALQLLLEPLNLAFVAEAKGLKVTSIQRLQGALTPVTYSVADLASPIESIQLRLTKTGAATPEEKQSDDKAAHLTVENMVELITSTCAPDSWSSKGGNGQITANASTLSLVIRQTRAVHEEIRDLLEQLRRLHDAQVQLNLCVVRLESDLSGISVADLKPGTTSSLSGVLTREQAIAVLKGAFQRNTSNVRHLPKMTLHSGQNLKITTDDDSPLSPLRISATPVVSADRQLIRMNLAAAFGPTDGLTTTSFPSGMSLLMSLKGSANDESQLGIPNLQKALEVDRLFKYVAKSDAKPGQSLYLMVTPSMTVTEEEESLLGVPE